MTGHRSSRRGETRGIWNDEQYVNLAAAFGQTDSRRMIQTGGNKPLSHGCSQHIRHHSHHIRPYIRIVGANVRNTGCSGPSGRRAQDVGKDRCASTAGLTRSTDPIKPTNRGRGQRSIAPRAA